MHAPIPVERAPAALHGLLDQGLAKDPKDRPSHATQLLASLESVARASYGADWETSGRQQLARRVALLSLLLPSLGGAAGVAAAATALGAGVGVFGSSGDPSGGPGSSSSPGFVRRRVLRLRVLRLRVRVLVAAPAADLPRVVDPSTRPRRCGCRRARWPPRGDRGTGSSWAPG